MRLLIITEVPPVPDSWWDKVLSLYGPMWLIIVGGGLFITAMTWKLGGPILTGILEATGFFRDMRRFIPEAVGNAKEWAGETGKVLNEIREDVKDVKRAVAKD